MSLLEKWKKQYKDIYELLYRNPITTVCENKLIFINTVIKATCLP